MNSDRFNEFMRSVGMMTELWVITYQGFKKLGLEDNEALIHTKAMTEAMLKSAMSKNGEIQ